MKNIFLADDDADDRMFFEDALRQLPIPTQLTLSNDGLELMSRLETVVPDAIFLDLNMPRKNGFQCLEEIRNTPKLKDIPIIILSTTADDDAVNKTYLLGANYYICKPYSFELLVKSIETVLGLEILREPQPSRKKFIITIA